MIELKNQNQLYCIALFQVAGFRVAMVFATHVNFQSKAERFIVADTWGTSFGVLQECKQSLYLGPLHLTGLADLVPRAPQKFISIHAYYSNQFECEKFNNHEGLAGT